MVIVTLVSLNVLAGLLPLAGLGRLALRARREVERAEVAEAKALAAGAKPRMLLPDGSLTPRVSDYTAAGVASANAPWLAWRSVRWDIALVGGGIILGTIANTVALF